jgi:hypothetical protein
VTMPADRPRRLLIRDSGPNPIDIFVGERLRARRKQLGVLAGGSSDPTRDVFPSGAAVRKRWQPYCRKHALSARSVFEGYDGPGSKAAKEHPAATQIRTDKLIQLSISVADFRASHELSSPAPSETDLRISQ